MGDSSVAMADSLPSLVGRVLAFLRAVLALLVAPPASPLPSPSPPRRMPGQAALTPREGRAYLVTGGHGLVGSHVVEALLARGETSVVVLGLEESPLFGGDARVRFVRGDVRVQAHVDRAAEGVQSVVHAEADRDTGAAHAFELRAARETNVIGTANVLRAARKAGATRVVFVSSAAVVSAAVAAAGGNAGGCVVDERAPYAEEPFACHHARTMVEAERLVLKANGAPVEGGGVLRTTAVRPAGVYGPRDPAAAEAAALALATPEGVVRDRAYAENVAHAVLLLDAALGRETSPVHGQAYFVTADRGDGDGRRPARELDAAMCAAAGVAPPAPLDASTASWLAAAVDALVWATRGRARRWLGAAAALRPAAVRAARASVSFSNAKARRDFGYEAPFTRADGVRRTAAYALGGAARKDE